MADLLSLSSTPSGGRVEKRPAAGDRPTTGAGARWVGLLLVPLIVAALALGCEEAPVGGVRSTGACCSDDDGCTVLSRSDCTTIGGFYVGDDVSCDPSPCAHVDVLDGAFVAVDGNDTYPGTPERPKRTIAAGVARAAELGRRKVYVAGGTYRETVRVIDGVSILGSYVRGTVWREDPGAVTTIVEGSTVDGVRTDCLIEGVAAPTVLRKLRFGRNDAVSAEGTYAVYVARSSSVTLEECEVYAGSGGVGADGSPGSDGADGIGGVGGWGGSGPGLVDCDYPTNCEFGTDGAAGGTCPLPGFGLPGPGGPALEPSTCGGSFIAPDGESGGDGADGQVGIGGGDGVWESLGSLEVWRSDSGRDGTAGGCGGGGGGGGSGYSFGGSPFGTTPCACMHPGVDGGRGGDGGEGGEGGTGGRGGGASIGVLCLDSSITLQDVRIEGGTGGRGGSGAAGGRGGLGTAGSPGDFMQDYPESECTNSWTGGSGGPGGDGGPGGSGGDGAGGVSFCVVKLGSGTLTRIGVTCEVGSGGPGGDGPDGNSGDAGQSGEYLEEAER